MNCNIGSKFLKILSELIKLPHTYIYKKSDNENITIYDLICRVAKENILTVRYKFDKRSAKKPKV